MLAPLARSARESRAGLALVIVSGEAMLANEAEQRCRRASQLTVKFKMQRLVEVLEPFCSVQAIAHLHH